MHLAPTSRRLALLVLALGAAFVVGACGEAPAPPAAEGPAEHPDERAAREHGHTHDHDHDHDHAGAGVFARLLDDEGAVAGHLELKLHDDAGDLELWLRRDRHGSQPLDLPLDTAIEVALGEGEAARTVTLRVRDRETNPDEQGTPTVRDGRTHYFIYPGGSGEDASWLMGATFSSPARVTVPTPAGTFVSEPFQLVPHGHGDADHEHE